MEEKNLSRRKKLSKNIPELGLSRSIRDYRRRISLRTPSKILVIVCEGKVTEPNYFKAMRQSLRLQTISIKVIPGKIAPITVVNTAIEEKNDLDDPNDEVWCVFDVENPNNNSTIDAAIKKAKEEKLKLAVSNPAFEYWYLIHFECTDRPFENAEDVINCLRKYLPNYEKSHNYYPILKDRTFEALSNTERLRNLADVSWNEYPNPSTGIDFLISNIIEISQQSNRPL